MKSQYTQDVEFNSGFGALQTPVHLYSAAAICGIGGPRIDRPFRYLDLACGNGLTLSLLAAAYPNGEFVGIDINPDHVQSGRDRAQRAELNNLSFQEGDVLNLASEDFEAFDFCTASGVYSWLDAKRRSALRNFVSSVVRPGGIIYLDYSCQPGIAQAGPLYHVLREMGKTFSGSSAKKLAAAAQFTDKLRGGGARFFEVQQVAAARLKTILQNPPEDEAHEVFNLQGNGLWSNEVIADLDECGFEYIGNAGLHHNLPALTPLSDAQAEAKDLPIALQQMLFDVQWNVAQRRDIYVRRAGDTQQTDFASLVAGLPLYAIPASLEIQQRQGLRKHFQNYDFCSEIANKVARIAPSVTTFDKLFEELDAEKVPIEAGAEAVRHFLAARLISISARQPLDVSSDGDVQMGSLLNTNILKDDIGAEYARPFASPVAGTRVLLPLKDRLYLWRLVGLDLGEAWDRLGDLQKVFRDANNEGLSREGFIQIIETSLPSFRKHAVPELLRLGILQPALSNS